MERKPLVKNAADKEQVKRAAFKEKDLRGYELEDLKEVLKTGPGRRVFWRLLEKCRVYESIWTNSARIHYNAGQQDLGHYIMAEIVEADEDAYFNMMKDNKQAILDRGINA